MKTIVVFDDGETWSCLDGCMVAIVSDSQFRKLEAGVYPKFLRLKRALTNPLGRLVSDWVADRAKWLAGRKP